MKIIGITGGSGVGKTAVLSILGGLGAYTVDADAVYHKLLKENKEMLAEIRDAFPCAFYNGEFYIRTLGKVVFKDQAALKTLSRITHKYVLAEIRDMLEKAKLKNYPVTAVDAAALFESGFDKACDHTIGVIAGRDTRISRIMARDGISAEYASLRVMAQQPDSFYGERCDFVIENNGDQELLSRTAADIYQKILNS